MSPKRPQGVVMLLMLMAFDVSGAFVGITIGNEMSNPPSATDIVAILKEKKIQHVRLIDSNHQMLTALANTGIEVMVGVPNDQLLRVGQSRSTAADWINKNVAAYVPATNITYIAVGDEVLTNIPNAALVLVPALRFLQSALLAANLNTQVKISSPHSMDMISKAFPPSTATFNSTWNTIMSRYLQFLKDTGSSFMLNAQPYYGYVGGQGIFPLDVSKSRRFDIAMSRRTRRSTSLVACFHDQYVPSLAHHHHQELKAFLECQDAGLKALQQCEDAEHLAPCLDEDEEQKIPQAPLQYEDDELKISQASLQYEDDEQYQDEQEKKSQQYSGEEQKKPEHYQGEKEKKPEQHKDEEEKTPEQYQDEVLMTPNQHDSNEDTAAERYQDPEQEAPQQCQEADEKASEQSEDDEEQQQKAQQGCCNMEQKKLEQFQGLKNLGTPQHAVDSVPRFSLQELIQQKQLQTGEAKPTSKLAGHGETVLPENNVSGSGGGAASGTTLAMVIKRPEGGKKSMGMIRRCVKALNQMIKTKHGSKKNLHM